MTKEQFSSKRIANQIKTGLREVFFIVIGILVALQINNWSEANKSKKELHQILNTVKLDLEADVEEVASIIEKYDNKITLLDSIFTNKIAEEDLHKCYRCALVNLNFARFIIQNRGNELLKTYNAQKSLQQDSLIFKINEFYNLFEEHNTKLGIRVEEDVLETVKFYREKEWYEDFMLRQDEATQHKIARSIFTDKESRNRILHYRLLLQDNYLALLKGFERVAKQLSEAISEELD